MAQMALFRLNKSTVLIQQLRKLQGPGLPGVSRLSPVDPANEPIGHEMQADAPAGMKAR